MALSVTSAKAAVKADINVTPLIDVMLVLLIIFMIVTPIIAAGFQATIPRSQNPENRPEGPDEIRLGIDREGKYYLDLGEGTLIVMAVSHPHAKRITSGSDPHSWGGQFGR